MDIQLKRGLLDVCVLSAIRAEDGCRRYDYYFSEENKNEILLIEEWVT